MFLFSKASRLLLGPTQPGICCVPGGGGGAYSLCFETDCSPACCAVVKNDWRYTSTPLYSIVGCTGHFLLVTLELKYGRQLCQSVSINSLLVDNNC